MGKRELLVTLKVVIMANGYWVTRYPNVGKAVKITTVDKLFSLEITETSVGIELDELLT